MKNANGCACRFKGKESYMKIESSHVNMASQNTSLSYTHVEKASIERRADQNASGAIMEISEAGELSYKESIEKYEREQAANDKKRQQNNLKNSMNDLAKHLKEIRDANGDMSQWDFGDDFEDCLVKKILDLLNGKKSDKHHARYLKEMKAIDVRSVNVKQTSFKVVGVGGGNSSNAGVSGNAVAPTSGTQVWERIEAVSGSHSEYENSTFVSSGIVNTADGRSINFGIEVGLSRSLYDEYNSLTAEKYTKILTDPLVINMGSNITSVSDEKMEFDLDADGQMDEVSKLGEGSGFLALDKNNDGVINDGSELFGTKSGDGFRDLAEYDEDKNGWIDENDEIFEHLKVWYKDENGNDVIMNLKKADIGAIYLGSANTEYTYKNDAGEVNGALRKTGIYLKESTGEAKTVAHVDLAL